MIDDRMGITPSTKVAALLDCYPQLEDVLIKIAPPFKKLKNPVLRKSVAKVASLRQAAAVAGMPVDSYHTRQPEWFHREQIRESIDERESDPDQMPLVGLVRAARALEQGEIVELITTFLPAPGIDIMKEQGFLVWSDTENGGLIRTYFSKPRNPAGS
jgi:hypothetical protein